MIPNTSAVQSLFTELEGFVQQIEASCAVIAEELSKGPTYNVARINAEMLKITHLRNQTFAFFLRMTEVQRKTADQQSQEIEGRRILSAEALRLSTRAGHIRVWLNLWTNVQSVLRDVLAERRRELYLKPEPLGGALRAQTETLDWLFVQLGDVLNPRPQSQDALDLGCYPDIFYPMTAFLEHLHAVYRVLLAMGRTHGVSFLDVGCGGGTKVVAARRFFDQSTGLEFDRNYARRARKLLRDSGLGGGKIIRANGITFRNYSKYEVIFMFRPMSDPEQLARLEQQVIDEVYPRTLILAPYRSFAARLADHGCPRIDGGLHLAKAPKSEAVRLRRRAEYMGPAVGRHYAEFPGLFDSILAAAAAKGFRFQERNALLDA